MAQGFSPRFETLKLVRFPDAQRPRVLHLNEVGKAAPFLGSDRLRNPSIRYSAVFRLYPIVKMGMFCEETTYGAADTWF
jgi:hypothetical protein